MTPAKEWTCIFSQAGLAAIKAFADRTTLFTFDLDGTLTPIIDDPSRIMISDKVREKMMRLSSLANVAILTGRARDDARSHLGFDARFIVGNHGAEGIPGWEDRERVFAALCQRWEDQLRLLLPHAQQSGFVIENKGTSLSVHYRKAPQQEAARREILQAIGRLTPLPRQISGKCVENILPQDSMNKGEALLQIMEQAGASRAVFVGDDDTDEDVFHMRNDRILGIRVGNESPSDAGYCLSDQDKIDRLLDEIIRALKI
jgi:trehalose 6-phosphate phosphatase